MERYWLSELKAPLPALNLPVDYARPSSLSYAGQYVKFVIDPQRTGQLKKLSQSRAATLYMTVLSVYFLFLYRITQDDDIVVGFPIAGRDSQELETMIGLFMNMVGIRIDFTNVSTFNELLETVKRKCLKAYTNGRYPFNKLVERINPERDPNRTPIFSTIFQLYDNVPQDNDSISLYDLSCICKMEDDRIEVRMEYKTSLFDEQTIRHYVSYFQRLIDQVIEDADGRLGGYELLDADLRSEIEEQGKGETVDYGPPESIHRLFERQAEIRPDQPAIVFEESVMTYRELNERANRLASLLSRIAGNDPEPIGIYCGRGIGMIVGILGVLKSGNYYVPLDVDFPAERLEYMIRHSGVRTIVTDGGIAIPLAGVEHIIDLSTTGQTTETAANVQRWGGAELLAEPAENFEALDSELMYVIYTSGSTGTPKGVMVTHRNALNYVMWSIGNFELQPGHRMMSITSISFDISVFEIFGALSSGASLAIVSQERLKDPQLLLEYIRDHGINFWHSVPSLISRLMIGMNSVDPTQLESLRNFVAVLIGGEAWSPALAGDIMRCFPNAKIFNMYGPTEATIWITYQEIEGNGGRKPFVTLGTPIANNRIRLLDKHGHQVGRGIHGEIVILGTNVTPGYYRDRGKTDAAFRQPSFGDPNDDSIAYYTGDIGQYNPDGSLDYIGREDGLVKVRGYRIEVGEIESRLRELDEIENVAVVAVQEQDTNRLICYYTTSCELDNRQLQEYLSERLPSYMIPAQFTQLQDFPSTSNGKLDRNALRAMPLAAGAAQDRQEKGAANEAERFLVEVWKRLLDIESVGTERNFFELGGNSNLIVQMHAQIEKRYPGKLSVTHLFKLKTVRSMAERLEIGAYSDAAGMPSTRLARVVDADPTDIDQILNMLNDYSEGHSSAGEILKKLGE